MKTWIVMGIMCLAVLASSLSPSASYANPSIAAVETYKNLATGYCLDSNAARQVYTLGCNGGSYQRWTVIVNSDGTRSFKNVATGYCLDSNAARSVYTLGCNGGSYQRWYISRNGSTITFKNKATGFCLDSNAARKVYTLGCNGGSYQRWY